ncbi:MAG: flagellar biosynthetic protein FliR [Candidatus Eremiobacteraeota bacterium]|nr:flagellar biosynthetic protein FliR [Candidatus Eremiobacteraeota bacterium]
MPDIFGLSQAQFETFLLVFMRTATMLAVFPIFSASQIPRMAKIAISLIIAFVLYRAVPTLAPFANVYELGAGAVSQVVLGLIVGFVAQIVFVGIQFAGQILDIQIGFAVANIINPTTQEQVTVIGELELALATLIFLISDSHLLLLQGIGGSFALLPLPYINLDPSVAGNIVLFLGQAFLIVLKIAAPAAVALFIVNIALGLMARVAPQMNVFVVGFPLQIGVGLIMLALCVPLLVAVAPQLFEQLPHQMDAVMRGMAVPSPSPSP